MKNIFKIKHLRNIFIISLIIAITLPAAVILYIYPSFTAQLTKNTEDEAIRVARHLMVTVIPDQNELTKKSVSAELMNKIHEIIEHFKLMKLKIFSKSGEIIYSTSSKDIGVINKNKYFYDIVAKGKVYTKVVEKDTKSLEDLIVTADVVETYVPIMKSDAFVGAFEIYYNITARKESLENILSTSLVALLVFAISLMAVIISVLISAGKNIIRREQIGEVLRESEEKIRAIFEAIADPVVMYDTQGHPKYLNPAFTRTFGWSLDELHGKRIPFVPDNQKEITGAKIKELYDFGKPIRVESKRFTKEGQLLDVLISAALIESSDGKPLGMVVNLTDITKRKGLEAQLQQAQKLDSIGLLAGGMAHDFNNLLSIIMGNLSMTKDDVKPEYGVTDFLNEAEEASLKAKELANQLITFSKGGAPVKKTGSIEDLVKETTNFALPGSNVKSEIIFPDDLWLVEFDESQIKYAVKNIIDNAVASMPDGGSIVVKADNFTIATERGLPLPEGKYVKISIRDQGIGIPEEHLSMIFDPYFTTKEMGTQKGMGLGLAATYSIINRHDGHIFVESEVGAGTTFIIYLPAHGKEVIALKPIEIPKPKKLEIHTGRILLMDDEKSIRKVTKQLLGRLGYHPDFAKDGTEAIQLYQEVFESGKPFEAVILDLTIKEGMGGVDTIKKLKEIDPQIRAIVSSGYSNDPVMTDFRKYGFIGALPKPYTKKDLGNVLDKIKKGKS